MSLKERVFSVFEFEEFGHQGKNYWTIEKITHKHTHRIIGVYMAKIIRIHLVSLKMFNK